MTDALRDEPDRKYVIAADGVTKLYKAGVVFSPEVRATDVGNSHRLVADHGSGLRFVPQWGTWLVWDGSRWRLDTAGTVVERAKAVARALWVEALALPFTDPDRKAALRWAGQSESAPRIKAMIQLAESAGGIPVSPDQLDANPWLLNVANGTIDLAKGALLPADPAHLLTKQANVRFDPDALAPTWEKFLERIIPDPEVREFLQRAVGYTLTGETSEQVLIFGVGNGSNGKSVLLTTLSAMLGDYAISAEPELLLDRKGAHPTGEADLHGARLVITSEIDQGRRLAEAAVKRLTGGDTIRARKLYADYFEFVPSHKLWIAANHRPRIVGTDHAIWRRIRLVPFGVVIPDEEQDKALPDKLRLELDGILAWSLAGCRLWSSGGLTKPLAVVQATAEYRADEDTIGAFLADETVTVEVASVSAANLYNAYQKWCESNGERASSQRKLGLVLSERGFDRVKAGSERRWHWIGLGLLHESPQLLASQNYAESDIDGVNP